MEKKIANYIIVYTDGSIDVQGNVLAPVVEETAPEVVAPEEVTPVI